MPLKNLNDFTNEVIENENVIVGSGAGRSTVAYELLKKNKVFNVGRYHSLKLHEPYFSKNLNITMRCTKTNTAMAFEDSINRIYGFQFHPDSFLTENGNFFIKKILSSK